MDFLSLLSRKPRLNDSQIVTLCSQFLPVVEDLGRYDSLASVQKRGHRQVGVLRFPLYRKSAVSPIAEAQVYLAYNRWRPALNALANAVNAAQHDLASVGVNCKHASIRDVVERMRQAEASLVAAQRV